MPRKRRFRPNWPYWSALFALVATLLAYVLGGAWLTSQIPRSAGGLNDFSLALVSRALEATIATWFLAVGASIGSFLNVVVYRLPLGRTLGGNSSCPFCRVPIIASDNIPVFGWLGLRGRCRACRLPISFQYPAVELAVGLVFLAVYFGEFSLGGRNLPEAIHEASQAGLMYTNVTPRLLVRTILLLFTLCGLIAAALMVIRRSRVPLSIFLWPIGLILLTTGLYPEALVVPLESPWTRVDILDARVHAVLSVLLGVITGILFSVLSFPLFLTPEPADPSSQACPAGQPSILVWSGAMATVGALLGWQSTLCAGLLILSLTFLGMHLALILRAARQNIFALSNPVAWAWLGVLLLRMVWEDAMNWTSTTSIPDFGLRIAMGSVCLVVLSAMIGWRRKGLQEWAITREAAEALEADLRMKIEA